MNFSINARNPQKVSTLFLHPGRELSAAEGKVNIIISPALYWFRDETLPVKSVNQAKKLAPSIFESFLPPGEYSYSVIKREESFWLFAYKDEVIAETLRQSGCKNAQVEKLYFAQTEFFDAQEALTLDEKQVLVNNAGVVTILPLQYVPLAKPLEPFCRNHILFGPAISVNLYQNSFIDDKNLYRLMAITIGFIMLYLGDYMLARHGMKAALAQQYGLQEHYQIPQTSFELEGLMRSLNGKAKEQQSVRTLFKVVLKLPYEKGEFLRSIQLTPKSALIEIALSDPKRAEVIKTALMPYLKITGAKVKEGRFYLEGKL